MNNKDGAVLFGLVAVFGLFYLFGRNLSKEQPRFQTDWNDQEVANSHYDWHRLQGGTGDHFLEPEYHLGQTVTLPVRFPARSGHEISCIIHKGWSQVNKTKPQDADWMWAPPSEGDIGE